MGHKGVSKNEANNSLSLFPLTSMYTWHHGSDTHARTCTNDI